MTVPKCTSWLGHKFEGRYSEFMPNDRELEFQRGSVDLVRAFKTIKYECDICVRCGHVIERKP
jgi:hypothetical protein